MKKLIIVVLVCMLCVVCWGGVVEYKEYYCDRCREETSNPSFIAIFTNHSGNGYLETGSIYLCEDCYKGLAFYLDTTFTFGPNISTDTLKLE